MARTANYQRDNQNTKLSVVLVIRLCEPDKISATRAVIDSAKRCSEGFSSLLLIRINYLSYHRNSLPFLLIQRHGGTKVASQKT